MDRAPAPRPRQAPVGLEPVGRAAGAEPELATGGAALRRAHRTAPLVLVGADALPAGQPAQRSRRQGVVVVAGAELPAADWAAAVELGAERVAVLPDDENSRRALARTVGRALAAMVDATERRALFLTTIDGVEAKASPMAEVFAEAGFVTGPRGLLKRRSALEASEYRRLADVHRDLEELVGVPPFTVSSAGMCGARSARWRPRSSGTCRRACAGRRPRPPAGTRASRASPRTRA